MKALTLAKMISGRPIGQTLTQSEEIQAQKSGLVVMFIQSEYFVQFRGALNDELDAFGGTDFILATPGTLIPKPTEPDFTRLEYVRNETLRAVEVEQNSNYQNLFRVECEPQCWIISTNIPHAKFQVMDGTTPYCDGIVVDIKDLK